MLTSSVIIPLKSIGFNFVKFEQKNQTEQHANINLLI